MIILLPEKLFLIIEIFLFNFFAEIKKINEKFKFDNISKSLIISFFFSGKKP